MRALDIDAVIVALVPSARHGDQPRDVVRTLTSLVGLLESIQSKRLALDAAGARARTLVSHLEQLTGEALHTLLDAEQPES